MSDDLSADLLTPKTSLLIQPGAVVGFTEWIVRTYEHAHRTNRVFVLLTRGYTALTLALARFIKSTHSYWIVDHPDGSYDGFTGRTAQWQQDSFQLYSTLHPAYLTVAPDDERAVSIQAETVHNYSDNPLLGVFSTQVLAGAGCAPPVRFDIVEPLTAAFTPEAVTEHARDMSPQHALGITSGADGDAVILSLPTRDGVIERLEFAGPCPRDLTRPALEHFISSALRAGANQASIGYRRVPRGRLVSPRCLQELFPLAFGVAKWAVLHTSLDDIVRQARVLGIETHVHPGLGLAFYFAHDRVSVTTLMQQYRDVLRLILPPDQLDRFGLQQH